MANKKEIKLIIDKIKSVITLKKELYDKLYDFLELLLELNEKENSMEVDNNNNNNTEPQIKLFAPYLYLGSDNKVDIIDCYNKTGLKAYTLAFLNKDGTWSNGKKYTDNFLKENIKYIQQQNGYFIISSGGADGEELIKYNDIDKCYDIYKYFIDNYNIYHFDFDVEGTSLLDNKTNTKRIKLIKQLKQNYPNLVIQFTLPVSPDGFHTNELNFIRDLIEKNTQIDIINIMTMDFGSYYTPNGRTDMDKYTIESLNSVQDQLNQLNLKNVKLGCTPMIGVNDDVNEIFSIDNARKLLNDYKNNNYYLLSFWCLNRDNGNKVNYNYASSSYSGIPQSLYQFTSIFNILNN